MTKKQLIKENKYLQQQLQIASSMLKHQDVHLLFLEHLLTSYTKEPSASVHQNINNVQCNQQLHEDIAKMLEEEKQKRNAHN